MDPEQDDGWDSDDPTEDVAESDEQLQKAVPEGRRVVRKHKKRQSPRETLYLKRREILREMEDGEGEAPIGAGAETGPVTVKEQVERLKDARKLDEPLEEGWGSAQHRRRGSRWILLVVLLVAAPLVTVIVYVANSGKRGNSPGPDVDNGSIFDVPDGPIVPYDPTSPAAWFHENSVEAFEDALAILEKVNEAGQPAELARWLRDSKRAMPVVEKSWTGEESPYFLDDLRGMDWEYGGTGDTGFMAIFGRLENHEKFRSYFVKTDAGLKLDWEATRAWSPISVDKLPAEAPKQATLVRCWLGKQPDYDMFEGHGSLYSWYRILAPNRVDFVWAYVPAGSKRDEQVKKLLNYGMIVMERKVEVRAIVRLVKPTLGFRETEFELVELVTEDWVMP